MKKKLIKATHAGELDLNGFKLSCAVLEDGTRVFSERSLAIAFGIKGGGAYWKRKRENDKSGSAVLPEYLSARYLKAFIANDLRQKLGSAAEYESLSGTKSRGVDATVLPEICDVYIQAKKSGIENANLDTIAENAYVMIKGFAKVGIVALVDEATGYQYTREKDELQQLLKAYIAEELLPWQKTFPDIFYREIFRLNKWDFTLPNIKKRPGVVGTWTNKFVYEQLPPGVLKELKEKTPKSEAGNYTARLFQSLTPDIGNPHLQNQLNSVITLMQVSDNWKHFVQTFNKLLAHRKGVKEIPFSDLEEKPEPKKASGPLSNFDKLLKVAVNTPPPPKKGMEEEE